MGKCTKRRSALKLAVVLAWIVTAAAPAFGLISYDNSTDIGQFIGANTFYNNGYTGSGAFVANIEAGYVWDGHVTLTNVTTHLPQDTSTKGDFDMHATEVGSAIAGQGSVVQARGIAYSATLWTGAIATSWNSAGTGNYSTSFNISASSFTVPYLAALINGVNGQTADVINSSYTSSAGESGFIAGAGQYQYAVAMDSLINSSGKLVVFSAGNLGPTTNTIGYPASGTNTFDVGALTSDTSSPEYGSIASFSSVSPSDFFVPSDASGSTGKMWTGVRARVDITAPGTNLDLAYYGGATGGNIFGGPTRPDNDLDITNQAGTSFAAPIVAGGAALVVEVGKALYSSDTHATDGRVLKAVLMNSADKPVGWNNGQSLVSNVVTTTQSLDYTYGAGMLNFSKAYAQYTSGTPDISSLTGGSVQSTGWAYGQITHINGGTAKNDYTITGSLAAGSIMNATLDWYSDEKTDANGLNPSFGSFDNLDLRVYLVGASPTLVAQSDSTYNSAEELSFALPSSGSYMVEVLETNYLWNFVSDTTTSYGLAWSVAVPEPTIASVIILGSMTVLIRRRRVAASIGSGLAA